MTPTPTPTPSSTSSSGRRLAAAAAAAAATGVLVEGAKAARRRLDPTSGSAATGSGADAIRTHVVTVARTPEDLSPHGWALPPLDRFGDAVDVTVRPA